MLVAHKVTVTGGKLILRKPDDDRRTTCIEYIEFRR